MNDFLLHPVTRDGYPDTLSKALEARGYYIQDEYCPEPEVDSIVRYIRKLFDSKHLRAAGIGKNIEYVINETVRGDLIHWIDKENTIPELKILISRLEDLMIFINRSLLLGLKDIETHLTNYLPGSYYRRHTDKFRATDHRVVTFLLYLNNGWVPSDGGQLNLYLPSGETVTIDPIGGRALFFMSEMEHEVLITRKPRYSVTGWFLDVRKDLSFL